MNTQTLRLFNAIQVSDKQARDIPRSVFEHTVRNGYLLDPAIQPTGDLLAVIDSVVGMSGEKANAAFHKSWAVVRDASIEQLVIQQIIHYITTYGFEELGIYRQDAVYIPHEILELPAIGQDVPLVVIKALTSEEILEHILKLGCSGIALAQETLDDMMVIIKTNQYAGDFVSQIENRELKALLYDHYNIAPTDPIEWLRYVIGKLTGESLLIKNAALIEKIKAADGEWLGELLETAPDDLASIFFRFKPLWLAMKSVSHNKTFFNRLRKQADSAHSPLPPDYLNSVTAQIKSGDLHLDTLRRKLDNASIFRKIRLAYALKFRLTSNDSIVYRVRNGRGWATDFEWSDDLSPMTDAAYDIVLNSIITEIGENIEGQTIYIPADVHYALPATEKQFTGFLPTGSYITVSGDLIAGIHWQNTDKRVDLDLSVIGESGKIGWDASYRTEDRAVLFSGDVTDAPPPLGASELFYMRGVQQEARLLVVNYYNFSVGDQVDCRLLVAQEKPESFGKNYMVDVGKVIASAQINITRKQTILGLLVDNKVYFSRVSVGNSITSSRNDHSTHARRYLFDNLKSVIDFREVLRLAGADVVDSMPVNDYIDLSPQALDKTTILDLIVS